MLMWKSLRPDVVAQLLMALARRRADAKPAAARPAEPAASAPVSSGAGEPG